MNDLTKNYTYYLNVFFHGARKPAVFRVRQKETERFKRNLSSFSNDNSAAFVWFETLDGTNICLNLAFIQAVRVLWEPQAYPEQTNYYDGMIRLFFIGREEPVEANTEDPELLIDFYQDLENGPDIGESFVSFLDEDGEDVIVKMQELLYVECPNTIIQEGWKIVKERDGISDEDEAI